MILAALVLAACTTSRFDPSACKTADCARVRANLATAKGVDDFRAIVADIAAWPNRKQRARATRLALETALEWVDGDDATIAAFLETRNATLNWYGMEAFYYQQPGPASIRALLTLMQDRDAPLDMRANATFCLTDRVRDDEELHTAAIDISDDCDASASVFARYLALVFTRDELRAFASRGCEPFRYAAIFRLADEGDPEAQQSACVLAKNAKLSADVRGRALSAMTYECLVTMLDESNWFDGIPDACDGPEHSVAHIAKLLGSTDTAAAVDLLESLETLFPRLDEATRNSIARTVEMARLTHRLAAGAVN